MAYLSPDFDYDVFVSYSHGDPRAIGESPLKTWSHALIEALIADITSLSDEFDELAVWYDRDLDPTLQLTPELRRKVKAAAVLMILMSPRYLKSAWCGDERTWFQEQIDDRAADEGRVFIVRAVPTDEGAWPDFLRDERGHAIVGFRFHPPPRQPGDIVEPFGWPDLISRNEPFRRELATLRTVLTRRLRELKKRFAVDHPGRRARLAPSHLARLHQQVMVDRFPPSIVPPLVEIALYGRPGFFLPVRVLSRLFRRLMREKLAAAHAAGRLAFFGTHTPLADDRAFAAFLAPLQKTKWFVYSKPADVPSPTFPPAGIHNPSQHRK